MFQKSDVQFFTRSSDKALNRLKESFCALTVVLLIVPDISLPYNKTDLTV